MRGIFYKGIPTMREQHDEATGGKAVFHTAEFLGALVQDNIVARFIEKFGIESLHILSEQGTCGRTLRMKESAKGGEAAISIPLPQIAASAQQTVEFVRLWLERLFAHPADIRSALRNVPDFSAKAITEKEDDPLIFAAAKRYDGTNILFHETKDMSFPQNQESRNASGAKLPTLQAWLERKEKIQTELKQRKKFVPVACWWRGDTLHIIREKEPRDEVPPIRESDCIQAVIARQALRESLKEEIFEEHVRVVDDRVILGPQITSKDDRKPDDEEPWKPTMKIEPLHITTDTLGRLKSETAYELSPLMEALGKACQDHGDIDVTVEYEKTRKKKENWHKEEIAYRWKVRWYERHVPAPEPEEEALTINDLEEFLWDQMKRRLVQEVQRVIQWDSGEIEPHKFKFFIPMTWNQKARSFDEGSFSHLSSMILSAFRQNEGREASTFFLRLSRVPGSNPNAFNLHIEMRRNKKD